MVLTGRFWSNSSEIPKVCISYRLPHLPYFEKQGSGENCYLTQVGRWVCTPAPGNLGLPISLCSALTLMSDTGVYIKVLVRIRATWCSQESDWQTVLSSSLAPRDCLPLDFSKCCLSRPQGCLVSWHHVEWHQLLLSEASHACCCPSGNS